MAKFKGNPTFTTNFTISGPVPFLDFIDVTAGDENWRLYSDADIFHFQNLDEVADYITLDASGGAPNVVVINEDSNDIDFRIEGDTDANLFFTDASTDRVGIGTNTPAEQLDITGNFRVVKTRNADQNGIIYKAGEIWMHDYTHGDNGTVTTLGFNIFIGEQVGNLTMGSTATINSQASNNIGIGSATLVSLTTGFQNLAFGNGVLNSCTVGSGNVGFGVNSLFSLTVGTGNFALGDRCLFSLVSGSNNTAYGTRAGFGALGSGNVFLGYFAGSAETGSNRLYIHNDSITTATPLVYGEFDNRIFRINGGLQINEQNADIDSYFKGTTLDNLLYIDAGADRVGFGTSTPANFVEFNSAGSATVELTIPNNQIGAYRIDRGGSFTELFVNGLAGTTGFTFTGGSEFGIVPDGTQRQIRVSAFTVADRIDFYGWFNSSTGTGNSVLVAAGKGGNSLAFPAGDLILRAGEGTPDGDIFIQSADGGTEFANFKGDLSEVVYNDGAADVNFRIEGDTEANLFFVDAGVDRVGFGLNNPDSFVHIDQTDASGALPVLHLDQADVSEQFVKFTGSAAVATLTQSFVAEADVTTATRVGFLKVNVQDEGNQITDGDYYIPFFSLA